jgi:hypothetical protein
MDFINKKTTELSDTEINKFCSLYTTVFCKADKSIDSFKKEYMNSALGYSYHSLMFAEGELVGAHNEIPVHYIINGEKVIFCFGTDVMIKEGFRNFFNLAKLVRLSEKALKDDGIMFIFGFPNEKSYSVFNKAFKYRDIGFLNTYILPYRIGGINPKLKFLNPFSIVLAKLMCYSSKFRTKKQSNSYLIDKDREEQANYRFKWFGGKYNIIHAEDFCFVYKIILKDNIKTAFLLDLNVVNPYYLAEAVKYIIKKDNKNFDLLIYTGKLNFNAFPLIRIPKKFEPKKFNFHGKFLDSNQIDERLFSIENWNVNLLCYDLI